MPRGRMLSRSISTSVSIEAMSEWAQLLFDRFVIWADDYGRLEGDARVLRATVKPMSERPAADFAAAAGEMILAGVVLAYAASDRVYLSVVGHEDHQKISKRTPSKYPPPTDSWLSREEYLQWSPGKPGVIPGNPGIPSPREEKRSRREEKESKALSVSGETDPAPGLAAAARFWNDTLAPTWGKPKVSAKTLGQLGKKYTSLQKRMATEHPDWTLEASLRRAFETLPGLRSQTWFEFRSALFEHDYHAKNEKLWTGFYVSLHGTDSQRGKVATRPLFVAPHKD